MPESTSVAIAGPLPNRLALLDVAENRESSAVAPVDDVLRIGHGVYRVDHRVIGAASPAVYPGLDA